MSWQYWSSKFTYIGIIMISQIIGLTKGLTHFDLIKVNPGLNQGGFPFSSKFNIMEKFRGKKQFLNQELFIQKPSYNNTSTKISFPLILKPNIGVVGVGVTKINSQKEFEKIINQSSWDMIAQEYSDEKEEYGVFYVKMPNEDKGKVISLTKKIIPTVHGNGKNTVKELIKNKFFENKDALLTHAKNLSYVPKKNETYKVIHQASHTYGAIFKDYNHKISSKLNETFSEICKDINGVYFGRFDVKTKNFADLEKGRCFLIELNGGMSEPIHIYDDEHSVWFGIKEFIRFYSIAYTIAEYNIRVRNQESKESFLSLIKKSHSFLKHRFLVEKQS